MNVFITAPIMSKTQELLEAQGHKVVTWSKPTSITHDELHTNAKKADALVTMLSDKIDANFLKQNTHLKVITNYAVGYNNIDIDAATKHGIAIGNTPDVLTEATADLALALMINISRKITLSNIETKNGKWKGWEPLGYLGQNLRRKKLGIIGAGRIGQHFATTCKHAFDMEIFYTARSTKGEFESTTNARKVELDTLLKNSDVVSIHCDLNEQTENLINKESLSLMKSSAILINTARGAIINERDLLMALKQKSIWGAGLDVTNPEPMDKSSELLLHPSVLVTPHIGSATLEARELMCEMVAKNIIFGLEKKSLAGDVNKLFTGKS